MRVIVLVLLLIGCSDPEQHDQPAKLNLETKPITEPIKTEGK